MKNRSGQTLVEMVVAVGMVSLVLVAIVSGIAISIRNSRFSKNKSLATRYAQEGIEKFRVYRDEFGWEPFFDEIYGAGLSVTYCLPDLPDSLASLEDYEGECTSETIGSTEYTRYAEVTVTDTLTIDYIDVSVIVAWIEGSNPHTVELSTRFNDRTNK